MTMRHFAIPIIFLFAASILIILVNSGPVLFSFREKDDPLGEPFWVFLNPLRDKIPEKVAENFLIRIKNRNFLEAFNDIRGANFRYKKQEIEHPIVSWNLASRKGSSCRVRLYFRAQRQGTIGTSPLWIDLEKKGNAWEIVNFEAIY